MISSFETNLTRPRDQHTENVQRAGADRDKGVGAIVILPKQATTAPIEAKALEQKNLRRGGRVHAALPATACANQPLFSVLLRRDFGAFRKNSEDLIAVLLPLPPVCISLLPPRPIAQTISGSALIKEEELP
jgi:hypothetical protein